MSRNEQLEKMEQLWFKGSRKDMIAGIFEAGPFTEEEKEKIKKVVDEWYKE